MPTFNDSENVLPFVPEGDYILCVEHFGIGLSQGAKTRGCEQYKVEFSVEGHPCYTRETMTDHPSCSWKIDTFLKASGVRLPKGTSFKFSTSEPHAPPAVVNPLGLRCHAKLAVEDWVSKDGTKKGKQNKVVCFYTDRPALDRAQVEAPEPEEKPF